jgi:hypothetical protein
VASFVNKRHFCLKSQDFRLFSLYLQLLHAKILAVVGICEVQPYAVFMVYQRLADHPLEPGPMKMSL